MRQHLLTRCVLQPSCSLLGRMRGNRMAGAVVCRQQRQETCMTISCVFFPAQCCTLLICEAQGPSRVPGVVSSAARTGRASALLPRRCGPGTGGACAPVLVWPDPKPKPPEQNRCARLWSGWRGGAGTTRWRPRCPPATSACCSTSGARRCASSAYAPAAAARCVEVVTGVGRGLAVLSQILRA